MFDGVSADLKAGSVLVVGDSIAAVSTASTDPIEAPEGALVIDGGGRIRDNDWTSDGVGNYWSDFAGYDADGDGIGDIAHQVDDLFSDLTDRHPELEFFNGTPAARAVDMAGRAFPNLRPEPKLTDEAPLVSVPDFPEVPTVSDDTSRPLLAITSVGLLAIALFIVAAATPSRATRSFGAV